MRNKQEQRIIKLSDMKKELGAYQMATKASYAIGEAYDQSYNKDVISKIKEGFYLSKGILLSTAGLLAEPIQLSIRKHQVARLFNLSFEEVATSINDLNSLKGALAFCTDNKFAIGNILDIEYLKKVQIFWGDATLQALDDPSYLQSLKAVYGSIYFSRSTNLEGVPLQLVTKDIHGEYLETANGLSNLAYVGGNIYYQDQCYTYEEWQKKIVKR